MLPAGPAGESIKGDLDQEYGELRLAQPGRLLGWWYAREAVKLAFGFWKARLLRRRSSFQDLRFSGGSGDGTHGKPTGGLPQVLTDMVQDLHVGLRAFRKQPAFAAAAVLTFAVGIGANTAMFSIVNGILWKPLPIRDPDGVVMVWMWPGPSFSKAMFELFREQATSYEHLAAMSYDVFTANTGEEAERLVSPSLSADFFRVLGTDAALGRTFDVAEDRRGNDGVVVLSDGYWRRRFGEQRDVIGKTIRIAGVNRTVIGVLPPDFEVMWAHDADVVVPMRLEQDVPDRSFRRLRLIGRLKDGVTPQIATAEFAAIMRNWREEYSLPDDFGQTGVVRLLQMELGRELRPTLLLLLGAVGLALLIATANVANLFLARTLSRQQEIGLRIALGAKSSRILRQLLTEATLVGVIGGVAGLLLATLGLKGVIAMFPPYTPRLGELRLDIWAFGFSALLALAAGWIVGLATALYARRAKFGSRLTFGSRGGTASAGRYRLRMGLVVAEIALAVVLVTGSTLLLQSFLGVLRVDPGFQPDSLLALDVMPDRGAFETHAAMQTFYDGVEARFAALPGVVAVGAAHVLPIRGDWAVSYRVAGEPVAANENPAGTQWRVVTDDYFRTTGMRLIGGRAFTSADRAGTEPVAVVNETLARDAWEGQDPIGRQLLLAGGVVTVVGIVGDVRAYGQQSDAPPILYRPFSQTAAELHSSDWTTLSFVLRIDGDPLELAGPVRAAMKAIDPNTPAANFEVLSGALHRRLAQPRMLTTLVAIFGFTALALGAIGIYGVMAHAVGERTKEMGIRIALGAPGATVTRAVLGNAAKIAGAGIAAGVLLALGLTRFLKGVLLNVSTLDPMAFVLTAAFVFCVALAAAFVPARRAGAVDPIEVLRAE